MFLISNTLKNEHLLLLLVLSSYVQTNQRVEPKFVDVGGITANILTATQSIGKDLNSIYTGWVDSYLYPYYLKGSTYVNAVYGQVNRTGLVVAGAALLGVSGVVLLGELNALPSLESMAKGVKDVEGIMNNIFKGSLQFIPFKSTALDSFDRADVVHHMPGPPYNYDILAVMNLTSNNLKTIKNRNNGITAGDFTTIDKFFEESSKDTATKQGGVFKSDKKEKKLAKKKKNVFIYKPKFQGQTRFENQKPRKYSVSKNNGGKYFKSISKTKKFSPTGYSYYESDQYLRKPLPKYSTKSLHRKPYRRKIPMTVPTLQSLLPKISSDQEEQEWRGILGLVGL